MFDYSEVRCLSPSISFIFSHLGASFESFGGGCPQVELFISKSSTLGLVLADLSPPCYVNPWIGSNPFKKCRWN